jgi:3-hydroxyacyl-[acyl-carrier-protein] dehydratase
MSHADWDGDMRFQLIDRIEAVEVGASLRASKHLTLAEEYLADHFPTFPVMPGVLQLQALVEAGSWLLRVSENFAHSVWALREVRGVKFGTFVAPGRCLNARVELIDRAGAAATLKGRAEVEGQQTIAATMVLRGYNLADLQPSWAERDRQLIETLRMRYEWLTSDRQRLATAQSNLTAAEARG